MFRTLLPALLILTCTVQAQTITGELKRWHPVTLDFSGPQTSETDDPNPFTDFRLSVTFTQGNHTVTVPGYFAADGNAAETSATEGSVWRVHFVPDQTGTWSYTASFRSGENVALSLEAEAGEATGFDGTEGEFEVAETDKTGRDHRGKGLLRYVGERYLQFDNGEYFLKGGADSPENLLGYVDFDNTYDTGGSSTDPHNTAEDLHHYEPHVADWNEGDPTWGDGKGKGLIGGLNYLASEGMNAFSFLPMNIEGDGQEVWPWTEPDERFRFDVSKLAQWEVVFTHADELGLFLHFKTQETENDQLLDGGELGPERRLYYRELVARFGHHLALNWNLGEENTNTTEQAKAFASYFHALDPYNRPVVVHTYPNQYEEVYAPLLGFEDLDGASVQLSNMTNGHAVTLDWLTRSGEAGKQWVVALDEPGTANDGVTPDGPGNNHRAARIHALWANLMAGGAGIEWYFGYQHPHSDLNLEDWRSRDTLWDYTRYALTFFREHLPFHEMESADDLLTGESEAEGGGLVFAKSGEVYTVYLPEAESTGTLDLSAADGSFDVRWFNPRTGEFAGSERTVEAGGGIELGAPPAEAAQDWVVLVKAAS